MPPALKILLGDYSSQSSGGQTIVNFAAKGSIPKMRITFDGSAVNVVPKCEFDVHTMYDGSSNSIIPTNGLNNYPSNLLCQNSDNSNSAWNNSFRQAFVWHLKKLYNIDLDYNNVTATYGIGTANSAICHFKVIDERCCDLSFSMYNKTSSQTPNVVTSFRDSNANLIFPGTTQGISAITTEPSVSDKVEKIEYSCDNGSTFKEYQYSRGVFDTKFVPALQSNGNINFITLTGKSDVISLNTGSRTLTGNDIGLISLTCPIGSREVVDRHEIIQPESSELQYNSSYDSFIDEDLLITSFEQIPVVNDFLY